MRQLYVAPTTAVQALMDQQPAAGVIHAIVCPGAPQWSLVRVDEWFDPAIEDEWEDRTQVRTLHPEDWGQTVPAVAVTAFGPWGVVATDTIRQAMRKVRAQWPAARL